MDNIEEYMEKYGDISEEDFNETLKELDSFTPDVAAPMITNVLITMGADSLFEYAELMGCNPPDESVKDMPPELLAEMIIDFAADQHNGVTDIPDFPFISYIRHMVIASLMAEKIKARIEIDSLIT